METGEILMEAQAVEQLVEVDGQLTGIHTIMEEVKPEQVTVLHVDVVMAVNGKVLADAQVMAVAVVAAAILAAAADATMAVAAVVVVGQTLQY